MIRRTENRSAGAGPLALATLFCSACSGTPGPGAVDERESTAAIVPPAIETPSSPEEVRDTAREGKAVFIQDSSLYSATFLAAFRERNGWIGRDIQLRGDSMLAEGDPPEKAIILPTDLPLRKKVHYARDWKGRQYLMDLTRLNISTVAYRYSVDDGRAVIFERKGTADLDPTFYFANEGEFEDGGQYYGMNKYHPNDTSCADYLLIGVGSIAMADYIRYCPDKDSILSMGMYKQ